MTDWSSKVADIEGDARTFLQYKFDQKRFRISNRNAQEKCVSEFQFADDAALLETTCSEAEQPMLVYTKVVKTFSLEGSLSKMFMVMEHVVINVDKAPIVLMWMSYLTLGP